jgi:inner membrane protein
MPSPVGHILIGAAVHLAGTRRKFRSRTTLAITLLGSIVPDLDFLPGILIGKMGAFHHGISHSLTLAILFGVLVFLFVRPVDKAIAVRTSMLAAVAYASHVGLDFIGVNEGTRGVPIFWPLTDEKFGLSLNLFGHFRWGDIREGLGTIIRWENVVPILREIMICGTAVLLLLWRDRRSSWKSRSIVPQQSPKSSRFA